MPNRLRSIIWTNADPIHWRIYAALGMAGGGGGGGGGGVGLTLWDRTTIYASLNCAIIVSDNGLSSGRPEVIIWVNAGISLIGPLGIRNKLQWSYNRNSYILINEHASWNVRLENDDHFVSTTIMLFNFLINSVAFRLWIWYCITLMKMCCKIRENTQR